MQLVLQLSLFGGMLLPSFLRLLLQALDLLGSVGFLLFALVQLELHFLDLGYELVGLLHLVLDFFALALNVDEVEVLNGSLQRPHVLVRVLLCGQARGRSTYGRIHLIHLIDEVVDILAINSLLLFLLELSQVLQLRLQFVELVLQLLHGVVVLLVDFIKLVLRLLEQLSLLL